MRKGLKKYFIKKYRNPQFHPTGYPGYEKLKTVAIIFDPEMEEAVLHFVDNLENEGKLVTLLGYIPRKRKEIETEPKFEFICKTDIKWHGAPSSEKINPFLDAEYELFIDVLNSKEHPMDIITETVNADFKIGRMLRKNKGYNLTLDAAKAGNGKKLFEEINYYLKFINKDK